MKKRHFLLMTGGSSSVNDLWLPLREAAAMAKAALLLGDKYRAAPVAPAVANALFALTGQRLRNLPLKLSSTATMAGSLALKSAARDLKPHLRGSR